MFGFGKKYYSCKWLEHGIIFDHCNVIRVCCSQSHEGKGRYELVTKYQGEPIDWENVFAQKRLQREVQKKGATFESCKGCIELEKRHWDSKDYIDTLLFTHWIHCNCACTYCPAIRDDVLIENNKHYNVVPAVKDMIEKKILKKSAFVSIAGGEATIYPEFEELLELLIDYGIKNIQVHTSGIKYSSAIEKGLRKGVVKVIVSLDSACAETHSKIKLKDCFDEVVQNLKKYSTAQRQNKELVSTKYIILPGVNDNKKEMYSWIMLNKELGIKSLDLDIDIAWFHENHSNIPEHIYDLVLFAKNKATNGDFQMRLFDRACMVYNEYKKKNSQLKAKVKK